MFRPIRTHCATRSLDGTSLLISLAIGCFSMASLATLVLPHLASAEVSPTPAPIAKPETPSTPLPVAKKILGQWLTKEPLDGDMVMFVFAPDGKAYLISGTSASGNAIASQVQYRIDDKPTPNHLDLVLSPNATVETLFEFTPDGELRLQMLGTRPGKPRPAALTENATLFQKLSDDTTPPPGIEVKPSSTPTK